MSNGGKDDWPTAAASRIRVKVQQTGSTSGPCCQLFYNNSTGSIDLIPCKDDKGTQQQRIIYDDSDVNIDEEPTYQSYLETMANDNYNANIIDSFHPSNVIGAHLSLEYNINNPNTFHGMSSYASAVINIYSYPKITTTTNGSNKKNRGKRMACHKHYILDPKCCEDFRDVRLLIQSIQKLSHLYNVQNNNPLKCLVILNPFSGGGGESSKTGAKHVYTTLVKPMLEEAGVEHDTLITQRGGHAQERMGERTKTIENTNSKNNTEKDAAADTINKDLEFKDITEYDAIIAMGGDGILFEIFQGIHARSDEEQIMSKMKFGILACGTFNGLVKSILHWSDADYDHMESMLHICKGDTFTLDVAKYQIFSKDTSQPKKSYISFLSFAWGLIADCDFESECLRWLGHLRSDLWAVYRGMICRRQYRARFSYLPPNKAGSGGEGQVVMPKLGQPLPDGWVTFDEEEFLVFWVCNTSHAAHNMFTCPVAKMNDGLFHVLIVR